MKHLSQAASSAAVLLWALAARADTVFLKNGEWIDGKVSLKTNTFVELQIGDIGKIELPVEEIHSIEKNGRTGGRSLETYVEPKGKTEVIRGQKPKSAETKKTEKDEKSPRENAEKAGMEPGKDPAGPDPESPGDPGGGEKPPAPKPDIDPELQKRIETLVADLQKQKARNRVQAERHLEAIGQPAIPFLLPVAESESDLARIAVMRLFHSFGDQQVIDAALEGLLDDNEYVRDYANKCLKRVTGEDFTFQPSASPRRREAAHRKWADWWESEKKLLAEEKKLSERNR